MSTRSGRAELMRLEVPLGLFGAALIGLAFVFAQTGIPGWLPPAATTAAAVPSPLSGMTRSFVALASGHPVEAFRWHPLGPPAFVACVAAFGVALVSWNRGARLIWLGVLSRRRVWLWVTLLWGAVWMRQIVWLEGG